MQRKKINKNPLLIQRPTKCLFHQLNSLNQCGSQTAGNDFKRILLHLVFFTEIVMKMIVIYPCSLIFNTDPDHIFVLKVMGQYLNHVWSWVLTEKYVSLNWKSYGNLFYIWHLIKKAYLSHMNDNNNYYFFSKFQIDKNKIQWKHLISTAIYKIIMCFDWINE